jgi:23S rRNA (cytosine1962-C5)-methyltransferase
MSSVLLKKNREKPILEHHPWIMSGAVDSVSGAPEPGDLVEVLSSDKRHLGWGHYNPISQIQVRMLTFSEFEKPDDAWWCARIASALRRRDLLLKDPGLTACRLIFSEADFLPGLIVDRYSDFLVVQAQTAGIDRIKQMLAQILNAVLKPQGILERSDPSGRIREGLPIGASMLQGSEPPEFLEIKEGGMRFVVSLRKGQKTGFYFDQRDNRREVAFYAEGKSVLDAFSYTGAFSVFALRNEATSVTRLDLSSPALELGSRNIELNFPEKQALDRKIQTDVFHRLRKLHDAGERYEMIVLDPPKLAPGKGNVRAATRAYKDLNLQAMKLLPEEGILASFSCSGAVPMDLFKETIRWAAKDANRELQIIKQLTQGADHPVRLSFPESAYLKGVICRVI